MCARGLPSTHWASLGECWLLQRLRVIVIVDSSSPPRLSGILHDLAREGGVSLLHGPSGAASAQPEFARGWSWLRSWAVKDGVTVSNQQLKCMYDAAVTGEDCTGVAGLLAVLKDEVAAVI
jgi:hypothetical protein